MPLGMHWTACTGHTGGGGGGTLFGAVPESRHKAFPDNSVQALWPENTIIIKVEKQRDVKTQLKNKHAKSGD